MDIIKKLEFYFKEYRKLICQKVASQAFSGLDLSTDIQKIINNSSINNIFDIGANIGQTNTYFRKRFPQATIYSFEPVSTTFQLLKNKIGDNKNTYCYQFAFGSQETTLPISLNTNTQLNSLVNTNENQTNQTELVTVKTIDQFCLENSVDTIDILKTDTEGFDLEVIKGAINKLKERKIKMIFSEVTFNKEPNHTNFTELHDFLLSHGFRLYHIYDITYWDIKPSKGIIHCNALWVNQKALNNPNIMGRERIELS